MIVATLNLNGHNDGELVGRLRAVSQADVLCLTETWASETTVWSPEQNVLQALAP